MLQLVWILVLIHNVYGIQENGLHRTMENPGLFGGDMLGVDFDDDRNVIPHQRMRWPNAIVPYVIDIALDKYKGIIEKAMENYHTKTCVKFVPRKDENNYIRIFPGNGCYSHVGMIGNSQLVSLGAGCLYVGTAIHELGHALGLYHEQNRSDRDDYLNIFMQNVEKGFESNFRKLKPEENLLLTPFDYDSIMIYGNRAFSKDGVAVTMRAKNNAKLREPDQKPEMTATDAERINKMYCQ